MKTTKIIVGAALATICITSASLSPIMAQEKPAQSERRSERTEQVQLRVSEMQARKEENTQKRTELRKENANKEIERRIESLKKLVEKVKSMKRVSSEQITTLTSQINTEITNLEDLKTKIAAETDPAKLVELKKSIVDSYRIYALFMPKITLIAHADQVISTATLMKSKTTADSEAWKQIDSGETKAKQVISNVIGLLPSGYPANKATLDSARTMLKDAIKDLNLARPMLSKKTTE